MHLSQCLLALRRGPIMDVGYGIVTVLLQSYAGQGKGRFWLRDALLRFYLNWSLRSYVFGKPYFFIKDSYTVIEFLWGVETGSQYTTQTGLELVAIPLPQHSQCWDYWHAPLNWIQSLKFKKCPLLHLLVWFTSLYKEQKEYLKYQLL